LININGDATSEKTINMGPGELTEVSIETDGTAFLLIKSDPRVAKCLIRNVDLNWTKNAF